jgi:hypothetical protein
MCSFVSFSCLHTILFSLDTTRETCTFSFRVYMEKHAVFGVGSFCGIESSIGTNGTAWSV